MSGNTLSDVTSAVLNPVGFVAEQTDMQSNDLFKLGSLATSPVAQAEFASNLLNFEEGSKVTSELTGTKAAMEKKQTRAKNAMAKDRASDEALLGSARSAIDLMNPNSGQFTGQARTAAGQQELTRLLALFQQRQADFAGSRARPGIQQTRLV